MHELQQLIEEVYNRKDLLKEERYKEAVRQVIEDVDKGK